MDMGKTVCKRKLNGVEDQGVVLRRSELGEPYYFADAACIREPMIFRDKDRYLLYYDAGGPELVFSAMMLAESTDLIHWHKLGPAQVPSWMEDPSGDNNQYPDYLGAGSPWIFEENGTYYMYNTSGTGKKGQFAPLPYYTTLCTSDSLAGPWCKASIKEGKPKRVSIYLRPDSWYSDTACAGSVIENPDWKGEENKRYMMFFSAASFRNLDKSDSMSLGRGIGIARTSNLGVGDDYDNPEGNFWQVDEEPVIPLEEDVENAVLWFEEETGLWYMFVNHIHSSNEYTDAVWVYWTDNPNHWNTENKAEVISSDTCSWTHGAIGMATVVRVEDRLAMVYDANSAGDNSHFGRDIALAYLKLPLSTVEK